ncbi:MAG: UbiA family prenyltransferase [Thermoanaerobaculaceae bacterium]|nr:UbiA family prenyltransferase [Thermoanaerobaculaceae bacterium]
MRWRDAVDLDRPFTLLPPLLGIVSGAVCAFGSAHNPDPTRTLSWSVVLTVVLGSLCAALLNAASNTLNQIADLEADRINKPRRPIPSGRVSVRQAWWLALVLYVLGTVPVWLVVPYPAVTLADRLRAPLGDHAVLFLYVGAALATWVYSWPSFGRTKRFGIWANVTIAIPRGMWLKVAGWGMVASVWHAEAWWIGLVFGLFLLGASSTKDFSDMAGDAASGVHTLPVKYGVRKAAWMIAPSFVFPWLLMPLGTVLRDPADPSLPILTGNATVLVVLGCALTLWGVFTCCLLLRDPDALATTENHPSWTHMYLMMMTAQIGFAVAYMV